MSGQNDCRTIWSSSPDSNRDTTTTEVIPFVVEQAVANKKIDFLAMAEAAGNEAYADKIRKSKRGNFIIDLSLYTDIQLQRLLASFFFTVIRDGKYAFSNFRDNYIYGYGIITNQLQITETFCLQDFLTCANALKRQGDKAYPDRLFVNRFSKFVAEQSGTYSTFDSDKWDLTTMQISWERINLADPVQTLHFECVKNIDNKKCLKSYAEYLLMQTNLSVKTISQKINTIQRTLNKFEKPFYAWDTSDVLKFIDRAESETTRVSNVYSGLNGFAKYLSVHNLMMHGNPFSHVDTHFSKEEYKVKQTAPDERVMLQVFSRLNDVKNPVAVLSFLIMRCTGMRISQVAVLRKNCLVQAGDKYYIRMYISKMRKYVDNCIPPRLYQIIDEYRKTLPADVMYLFPSSRSAENPLNTKSIRRIIVREFNQLGITNSDGTPYHFTAHSLRHLMANRMLEANIPFTIIQNQLHHAVGDMTYVYVEYTNDRKARLMHEFVDRSGKDAIMEIPITLSDEELDAEILRKNVYAQMLPNGMCFLPVALGRCPHANKCLRCADFRTSKEFLPVHLKQKKQTEKYIEVAESNGWTRQAEEAKKDLNILNDIIARLESKKEDDDYASTYCTSEQG